MGIKIREFLQLREPLAPTHDTYCAAEPQLGITDLVVCPPTTLPAFVLDLCPVKCNITIMYINVLILCNNIMY